MDHKSREAQIADRLKQHQIMRQEKKRSSTSSSTDHAKKFIEKMDSDIAMMETELANSPECQELGYDQVRQFYEKLLRKCKDAEIVMYRSTYFLSTFARSKYKKKLKELETKIRDKREQVVPKERFKFLSLTRRSRDPGEHGIRRCPADVNPEQLALLLMGCHLGAMAAGCDYDLCDRTGENIIMMTHDCSGRDIAVVRITGCRVELQGCMAAIRLADVKDSTIFCGPCAGSVFVDRCSNSTFIVAGHQLRVHTTEDCTFRVHVNSSPIIEGCKNLKFASYDWTYDGIDKDYEESCLDRLSNLWKNVQDFDWLIAKTPSPNWKSLEEEEI